MGQGSVTDECTDNHKRSRIVNAMPVASHLSQRLLMKSVLKPHTSCGLNLGRKGGLMAGIGH
jgi:hypothetical protein